jgi:N-acyl homoserine lactone hydrolase
LKKLLVPLVFSLLTGCAVTSHSKEKATMGITRSSANLEEVINQPGPIVLETVDSCDWETDREGLINLDHPKAKEAGLKKGAEPIKLYFHVLKHPTQGTFLVDTGAQNAMRDAPGKAALRGMVTSFINLDKMKFNTTLGDYLAQHPEPIKGVFMTHLHFDHIAGMADVPSEAVVYTGPGEADSSKFFHAFLKSSANRALEGKGPIKEWVYEPDPSGRFRGVLDIFGDGSVWALWVPGHTPGSTAYLVRTAQGPVLLTGDASHTRWGWENDVEPGTFSTDGKKSIESFQLLRKFAAEHPGMQVRLGHQP